ncbi:TIGR00297 family protein [Methanogenium sp. MK-MG]|uniref:TIGR00297 family protein n=1 Tax=Methanogenium sp. MK-MG TaxID=2599926 RepID=UPI0013ED8746|nr:TIGR00297 family protein [Methanogenium sp. MK-MG]KAF1077876.1 hypothetical protein MKMG_01215 [Methanogenium sp. MK-MG]
MERETGMWAASALALICIIIAPHISPPWLLSLFVVLICALLFLIKKSRYTSLSIATIAALYGLELIPLVVFSTTFAIVIMGETAYRITGRGTKGYIPFTVVAFISASLVMMYSGYTVPFVAVTGVIVALMLHSILRDRQDGIFIETLGVAMTMLLFFDINYHVETTILITAVIIGFVFAFFSYKLKAADLSGLFSGALMGILLIVFTDVRWFLIMLAFFILGAGTTKYRFEKKTELGVAESHGGVRGYFNVFANGMVSLCGAILYGITQNPIFIALFLGSVACATSDTLASEVGVVGKTPRLITTFREVPRGTNGGVTIVGELAAIAGAVIIAAFAYVLNVADLTLVAVTILAGFFGTNIDSLIGALYENKNLIGNAGTNFLATLLSGIFAMAVYYLLISF